MTAGAPAERDTRRDGLLERLKFSDVAAMFGALAGVVGVVYVLGGIALYVELSRTGVPAGEALDQFSGRRFIVIGVPVTAVAGVVSACAGAVSWQLPKAKQWSPHWAAAWIAGWVGICLLVAGGVGYLAFPVKLRRAVVYLTTPRAACVAGAYVSTDSLGVHLADGIRDELQTIAPAQVARIRLLDKERLDQQAIRRVLCP
jgi:MFS family permease